MNIWWLSKYNIWIFDDYKNIIFYYLVIIKILFINWLLLKYIILIIYDYQNNKFDDYQNIIFVIIKIYIWIFDDYQNIIFEYLIIIKI